MLKVTSDLRPCLAFGGPCSRFDSLTQFVFYLCGFKRVVLMTRIFHQGPRKVTCLVTTFDLRAAVVAVGLCLHVLPLLLLLLPLLLLFCCVGIGCLAHCSA